MNEQARNNTLPALVTHPVSIQDLFTYFETQRMLKRLRNKNEEFSEIIQPSLLEFMEVRLGIMPQILFSRRSDYYGLKIEHEPAAIASHKQNFPSTTDISQLPEIPTIIREQILSQMKPGSVLLIWGHIECKTHFSKANPQQAPAPSETTNDLLAAFIYGNGLIEELEAKAATGRGNTELAKEKLLSAQAEYKKAVFLSTARNDYREALERVNSKLNSI